MENGAEYEKKLTATKKKEETRGINRVTCQSGNIIFNKFLERQRKGGIIDDLVSKTPPA